MYFMKKDVQSVIVQFIKPILTNDAEHWFKGAPLHIYANVIKF